MKTSEARSVRTARDLCLYLWDRCNYSGVQSTDAVPDTIPKAGKLTGRGILQIRSIPRSYTPRTPYFVQRHTTSAAQVIQAHGQTVAIRHTDPMRYFSITV